MITVESYKDVWHHKAKADYLCDIFGVSQSDLVAIGKPYLDASGTLFYAVIP